MAITKEVNIVVKESGMDKVNQSIQQLENAVHDTEQATKSFKTQMREANEELLKMSQKFGETSQEAVQAAKKVADLKDQMGLANDLVNQFNPDQKFRALGAATQLAGTGFQGLTAGVALLGDESEETQQKLLQVQSAMSFADAISNLSNLGDQWTLLKTSINTSTLFTKANTAATGAAAIVQKLFTGSVATTTGGFKLLRGAIVATGIGALIVAVGLVVANFDKFKKVLSNIGWLTAVGDAISDIVNSVTDFLGFTSESERVLDKQKQVAEKSLKQNESYLKKNEHKLSESRKREIELNNEHFQRIVDGEMSKEESLKILREKADIDKQKAQKEANEKAIEAQKKANEKAKEAEQKRLDDEKERVEKILDAKREELQKFNDLEKEFEQQREDERIKKLIAEDESKKNVTKGLESALQARKNGLATEVAIEEEAKRQKEVIADANMKIATSTVNLLSQLAGKNKALQRAGIVASAGIGIYSVIKDTQAANMAAIAPPPLGLGPIAGIGLQTKNTIQGALSVASITAASAKALASVGAGGSVSGGSTGGGAAPQAPSFNLVQGTGRNQLAESIGQQAPVKAFVVARDMSTGQEMDRNIIKSASL